MHKPSISHRRVLAAIIGLCVSGIASAQIEEIVVTAQKREENLQDVPVSIQAFTGESMAVTGIKDTDDLGISVPGLQMNQGGVANLPFIRGIGSQDATPGQDNSVSTYVDGVLQSSVTGSAVFFNSIQRVEVLKGPQGTLFGRNTTGGVINIVTKDPTQEPTVKIGASYGNYDTAEFNLYGATGLSENLAADVAVYLGNQGEGYSNMIHNGQEEDVNKREDERNFRSKWKYSGETWDATLIGSYNEFSDDMGYVRGAPPGSINIDGFSEPDNEWDVHADSKAFADFEGKSLSLKLKKSFEGIDIVSITAWQENDLDSFTDNDYTEMYFNNAGVDFHDETYTQELQFLSNGDGPFTWIAGAFMLDQNAWGQYTVIGPALGGLNTLQLNGTIDSFSVAGFGEVAYQFTEATKLTGGVRLTRDERRFSSNPGFVIQVGPLAPPNEGYFTGDPTTTSITPLADDSKSWTEPTYRIVLDHQINDDIMVYASYNKGFKSGNYITATGGTPDPFNPEFVDAYEVGIKSDLLDHTLRVNASAYYYDVQDLQFQILQGTTTKTVNAAAAEIKGAELDLTWLPVEELTLDLGVSYVDGEYSDFPDALSNTPCYGGNPDAADPTRCPFGAVGNEVTEAVMDVKGNQVGGTPEWMVTGAATWMHHTDVGDIDMTLRATYNDGFPWEPDGRLQQENYTIVNASIGWHSPDEKWGVRLNGKNLLEDFYSVSTRSTTAVGDFQAPSEPRTYYVTVEYNFM